MNLDDLMHLAWTFRGPLEVNDSEGQAHWEIRIAELAGFFLAAQTKEEVIRDLKPAMRAFFQSYLDHGELPSLPQYPTPVWTLGSFGRIAGPADVDRPASKSETEAREFFLPQPALA